MSGATSGGAPRGGEQELIDHLVAEFSSALGARQVRIRGEEGVHEMAARAESLIAKRDPGSVSVRVTETYLKERPGTVIEVLLSDQPFLVDTFRMSLRRLGLPDALWCHVRLAIERADDGGIASVGEPDSEYETYLYAELGQVPRPSRVDEIRSDLLSVFESARRIVEDHGRMVKALRRHTADLEFAGATIRGGSERARKLMSFLSWLADESFIFMGYRRYTVRHDDEWEVELASGSGLGLMRDTENSRFEGTVRGSAIPSLIRSRLEDPELVFFDKSTVESKIHREGRLDSVSVKLLDEDGKVSGFGRIIGLLTHKAIRGRGSSIPLLCDRRDEILEKLGAEPGTHDYKAAVEAFDSLPIEFLFPFGNEDILLVVKNVLDSMERDEISISVVRDPLDRSFFVSAALPREAYRDDVRAEIRDLLGKRYSVTYTDGRVSFVDDTTALIHFFCTSSDTFEDDVMKRLERDVKRLITRWEDRLESALLEAHLPDEAHRLLAVYGSAFPEEYRIVTPASDALADIEHLERLDRGDQSVELSFGVDDTPSGEETRLKLYQHERPYLTDLLPVLDDFDLRVIDATLTELACGDARSRWIVTFRVEPLGDRGTRFREREERVIDGLQHVLAGRVAGDPLNRLTLAAGLDWREVDLLRAYLGYAEQIGWSIKLRTTAQSLGRYPEATRTLLDYFRARFDPDLRGSTEERAVDESRHWERIELAREEIRTAHDDQVFAQLSAVIRATTRTNFYVDPARSHHMIVLKLDPRRIVQMPDPRPFAEIWVHSADVCGVHLRSGRVARGGIRWSDRVHDFRSEILELLKTQMMKNGVIVPTGSKGGFVLKKTLADPAEARAEADRQYEYFIEALLSLTDNLKGEEVVPPVRVVRHDGDDTYLVVAADKGTAHLSDVANAVSERMDYWLGDAFASGGSSGYDHKAEGITAKGAWVCVKRHFLEMGVDVESQAFSCTAIGDMSGDVFGNGLLLMKQARLLAAFNHQHVFVDPNPDPETSWAERKRLFELPRSTWNDYDPAKISAGGGVYERDARRIELSPEARMALDADATELSGEELVQAILRMPVDLLWNGGVGTYVKASVESNHEVGDRANDAVRIDASELGAKVAGEGGNLGFTQRARTEYAIRGGRIHTDAIDNSGGVDLSDHEVNFKILLAGEERAGRLTREDRNRELRACLDQATAAVLANNASQSLCISADLERGVRDPERILHAADHLVQTAGLECELQSLPEPEELRARVANSDVPTSYTRPELALLLGYTKTYVRRELIVSDVPDHPAFQSVLDSYFPEALRERYAASIQSHPLAREITATCLANRVIDQAGVTLVPELTHGLGASVPEVISAYHLAARLLETDHLHWEISEEPAPERVKLDAALRVESAVRDAARAFLGLEQRACLEPDELSHWVGLVRGLRKVIGRGVRDEDAARVTASASRLSEAGLKPGLAIAIESLPLAVRALGVLGLAMKTGASLPRAVHVHTTVGEETRIGWLIDRLHEPSRRNGSWDRVASECLYLEMLGAQRSLTSRILAAADEPDPTKELEREFGPRLKQIRRTIGRIEGDQRHSLSPLVVLSQQIRRLC